MKELLLLYIGFTMGMCVMDFISIKENYYLHLYKYSYFNFIFTLLFSPILFPFYLFVYIKNKIQEHNL